MPTKKRRDSKARRKKRRDRKARRKKAELAKPADQLGQWEDEGGLVSSIEQRDDDEGISIGGFIVTDFEEE